MGSGESIGSACSACPHGACSAAALASKDTMPVCRPSARRRARVRGAEGLSGPCRPAVRAPSRRTLLGRGELLLDPRREGEERLWREREATAALARVGDALEHHRADRAHVVVVVLPEHALEEAPHVIDCEC